MNVTSIRTWHVAATGLKAPDHFDVRQVPVIVPSLGAYAEADVCPKAIGDDPCVADHVRCVGYSDPRLTQRSLQMSIFSASHRV